MCFCEYLRWFDNILCLYTFAFEMFVAQNVNKDDIYVTFIVAYFFKPCRCKIFYICVNWYVQCTVIVEQVAFQRRLLISFLRMFVFALILCVFGHSHLKLLRLSPFIFLHCKLMHIFTNQIFVLIDTCNVQQLKNTLHVAVLRITQLLVFYVSMLDLH